MNPAKAAPSAPVKKAAREDPQILPGGLLILFFFLLLAVGEAVQRHHNQHEKADDQQDIGHADGHTVKEVRPRYSCFYKIRHPGDCDGQSGYGVSKLDSIVEEVVRQIFAQFHEVSRKKLLESVKTNDAARIQKKVKKIQKDLESKQKELDDLKAETILVIRGVSALDKELLGTLVAEAREALETLEKQFVQAQEEYEEATKTAKRSNYMEEIYMSRFYNNCVDEASLTTLCPICLDSFQGAKGVRVRRADPKQKIKDVCTYCQIRYGFDYYVQPDKNAGQYVKRGHFDDESECA